MNDAFQVLLAALIDSFRPKMLMLTLVSVAAALIFWIVIIWLSVDPILSLAISTLSWMGFEMGIPSSEEFFLLTWIKAILVPLTVFGLLWPIVAGSAVLLAGLYVTPTVVKYLSAKDFPHLARQGESGMVMSVWVTLKAVVIFLLGWIVTLPLWLIPGMAFVLPLLLTAYLLIAVMRFDALSEHATKAEFKQIKKRDSTPAWLIGISCAFLSFVPPILLIMPVLSALAFTRYYMQSLDELRKANSSQSSGPSVELSNDTFTTKLIN
jgi:CysZ protein